MTDTAPPVALDREAIEGRSETRRRRPRAVRRLAMSFVAFILAGLFVVVPQQPAHALAPVLIGPIAVAVGVPGAAAATTALGGLSASALATIGVTIVGGAALILGTGPASDWLGDVFDPDAEEPAYELEVDQGLQQEVDNYVQTQTAPGPSGDLSVPQTARGDWCSVTLNSYQWDWHADSPRLTLSMETGFHGPNYAASSARSNCAPNGPNNGVHSVIRDFPAHLVNTTTGATHTVAGYFNLVQSPSSVQPWVSIGSNRWAQTVTLLPPTDPAYTYSTANGWRVDTVTMRGSQATASYNAKFTWAPMTNPYTHTGDRNDYEGAPQGYWGVRECEPLNGNGPLTHVYARGQVGMPVPGPCPEGYASTGYRIFQGDPREDDAVELIHAGTRPGWNLDANGQNMYPNCVLASGAITGACEMRVEVDGNVCGYGVRGCAGWMELVQTHPDRVECFMSTYVMPWPDCDMLRYAYSTPYGLQVQQTATYDPTRSAPPLPTSPPTPSTAPTPATTPTRVPFPMTPTNPPPTSDPVNAGTIPLTGTTPPSVPQLNSNPRDIGRCMSAMWTWNPLDWVATPVRCVFEWAFLPTPGRIQAQTADMRARLAGTTAIQFVGVLGELGSIYVGGDGCSGPRVDVNIGQHAWSGYPLSACSSPMSTIAAGVKTTLAIGIVLGSLLACGRHIAGTIGFTAPGSGDPLQTNTSSSSGGKP